MAVIELDLDAPPESAPRRPPPAHRYRYAGLALAAVLVLALAGAAPVRSAIWQRLGLLPLPGGESSYVLVDGRIYTVDPVGDGRWRTTAWATPGLRRAWTVTTGVRRDPEDEAGLGGVNLVGAEGALLVQDAGVTSVVDPRTGVVRWAVAGPVIGLGSGLGLTVETTFRPGTEYDVASGEPGDLFWSATGRPHTEPPQNTTLHGVDLATGRRLWTTRHRGSVRSAQASGNTAAVVVVAADGLQLLAADTGRLLRETPLPGPDDVSFVDFTEDLLLIRNGRTSEPGSLSAYATDTIEFRWRTPVPRDGAARGRCFGLACGSDPSGITVLDPGTGRTVWRTGPGLSLTRRGEVAVEVGADLERQMRVREVATGAVRTELPSWDTVVNLDGAAPIVLRRREAGRGVTAFGVLLRDGSAVQPLGLAGELADDCLADERFVVCRTAAGAEVWSYRA